MTTSEPVTDTFFADVMLPVPVPRLFTYRVPQHLQDQVRELHRVIVPFGPRKIMTGLVLTLHHKPPLVEAKYILEVADEYPSFQAQQVKLIRWMAAYYLCAEGEVLNAAMPAGLKLSSESLVQLNPAFDLEQSDAFFNEKELSLLARLRHDTLTYTDVSKFLGVNNILSIIRSLTSKGAILLLEEIRDKYQPKTERRVRLTKAYNGKDQLEALFEQLAKRPAQEAVVLRYLQEVPVFQHPQLNEGGLPRKAFLAGGLSESSLSTLTKAGVFEQFEKVVPRFDFPEPTDGAGPVLSAAQEDVRRKITTDFEQHTTVLLQGVTGSGKTEIYIDLLQKTLDGGSQALLLLPEIALTTQIVARLRKVFGPELGIYHSRFSDNERVEVWNGVLLGKIRCVVGVRSSIFLPFDNLGLIIVDEEHDTSYKQDRSPRYHARDAAIVLAQLHNSKVLLGSATPSLESYYLAIQSKYGYASLQQRFGDAKLPDIVLADMSRERKQKSMRGAFTTILAQEISQTLKRGEQIILFQNRRGYSPYVECEDCNYVPQCINCAVSLTYHQYRHALVCHYCGYKESMPSTCPTCQSKRLVTRGLGTEKLEEETQLNFSNARVLRMDLETTRSKTGLESIIHSFEKGETDILVGTQMVTKGLDFDKVSLVGVFDTDRLMHFPDFRSFERTFQLIVQVSGRAGRRDKKGKVVIQTSDPEHPLFRWILKQDVSGFAEHELRDREQNHYPPFTRLIELTLRHVDKAVCAQAAAWLAQQCKSLKAMYVMGPAEPVIAKVRNEYLQTILLKIPRNSGQLPVIKEKLLEFDDLLHADKAFRNIKITFDVDPL